MCQLCTVSEVTPVGQRPVTESRAQVEASGFLDRVKGHSVICPDGNHAWQHAARDRGLAVQSVVHQVKNFTSVCQPVFGDVPNVAGTQMLDRSWQSLESFLPQHMQMKCKEKGHSKMHGNVPQYIYMWAWRQSLHAPTPKVFLEELEALL